MLIFQNQLFGAIGYPQPAILSRLTVSVPPQLLTMNNPYVNSNYYLTQQVVYSNTATANSLINAIKNDESRILSWQSAYRTGEANYNNVYTNAYGINWVLAHPYANTATARAYISYIDQANQRIQNYKTQLARLIVYVRPSAPLPSLLLARTVVYPGYPIPSNPYYDQYGRALYDTLGRPYFDQFGRPYPYTPYNLYRY
jgi:hypothetical protein